MLSLLYTTDNYCKRPHINIQLQLVVCIVSVLYFQQKQLSCALLFEITTG